MDAALKANILAGFGLAGLPAEAQDEAIEKIGGVVFQGVLLRVIERMNEGEQKRFEEKLAAAGQNPDMLIAELRAAAPDFDEIVQTEINRIAGDAQHILGH